MRTAPPPRVGCGRGGSAKSRQTRAGTFVFFWFSGVHKLLLGVAKVEVNCVPFLLLFTRSSSFLLISRLSRSGVCSAFIADRHEEILTATKEHDRHR
jgi:hypothetical protein